MDESSQGTRSLLGEPIPGARVDRDLVFARVEQRLLGRALNPVRVGRFVVLRRVGHGGMGVVYAAHDPELDRKVAVKVVGDGAGSASTAEAHQELLREARAAAALTHPNVVTVYEVGVEGEGVFLAMEYVEGPTLRGWLTAGTRSWREVVGMFVATGRGLYAAHQAGLVHRDFKPDNVLIGEDGRPRVADFGLARPTPREPTEQVDDHPPSSKGAYTAIAGTPRYMAPEQHQGHGIGPASDQFAFCVALYEALFDRHPFAADSKADMVRRVLDEPPDPPRVAARGLPPAVVRLVMRGLSAQPHDRHPSIEVLIDGLQRAVGRRRRIALATGALGLLGVAATLGYGAAPEPEPAMDPCAEAAAPMAARWSSEAQATLHEAFVATGQPGVTQTVGLVRRKLDAYAHEWSAARLRICEATRVKGQRSDLLMELSYACLERRLTGMSTLLERFARADAATVARATEAVDDLPPLAPCEDRGTMLSMPGNAFSSRTDRSIRPEAYEQWSVLLERLHRADALQSVGARSEALTIAQEVLDQAAAGGLRGVEAAARNLRGRLRLEHSELDSAREDLRRAASLALESDRTRVAVEALLALSELERTQRHDLEQARVLLPLASGLARKGAQGALELKVATEQARVQNLERDYRGARDRLVAALETANSLGPDHTAVLEARNDLAANLAALGRYGEAEQIFVDLLPRIIEARGPRHRLVGTFLVNLGVVTHHQKRADQAVDYYRRALEFYTAAADSAGAELVRFRLGVLHREQGDLVAASRWLHQALTDRTGRLGSEHADLAELLEAIAEVERQQGRYESALEHVRRAVTLLEQAHGPDYLDLRAPLVTIGKIQLDRGDHGRARVVLERAHALVTATEVDAVIRAEVYFDLARALTQQPAGRARALELARQARALLADAVSHGSLLRKQVEAWLAEHSASG